MCIPTGVGVLGPRQRAEGASNGLLVRVAADAENPERVHSATGEVRWPLLDEGGHSLLEVLGPEQREQLQEHVVDVLLEGLRLCRPHHALDRSHGQRGVSCDLSRHGHRVFRQVLGFDDMVDDAASASDCQCFQYASVS